MEDPEFSYRIEVTEVEPITGGTLGGTLLTITGVNFSSVEADNNVFLT